MLHSISFVQGNTSRLLIFWANARCWSSVWWSNTQHNSEMLLIRKTWNSGPNPSICLNDFLRHLIPRYLLIALLRRSKLSKDAGPLQWCQNHLQILVGYFVQPVCSMPMIQSSHLVELVKKINLVKNDRQRSCIDSSILIKTNQSIQRLKHKWNRCIYRLNKSVNTTPMGNFLTVLIFRMSSTGEWFWSLAWRPRVGPIAHQYFLVVLAPLERIHIPQTFHYRWGPYIEYLKAAKSCSH